MKSYLFLMMLTLSIFQWEGSLCISSSSEKKQCLALALSGCTNRGAYQSGVIKGLVENLSDDAIQYDVLTGVGFGALNAGLFAAYEKGQEEVAKDALFDIWSNLQKRDVYQNWEFGIVNGLINQKGLFDASPFKLFLQTVFGGFSAFKRFFTLGVVEANSGKYYALDMDNLPYEETAVHFIQASSVEPGLFPFINEGDKSWISGESLAHVDIVSAIERCREIVDDDSQITVDVVLVNRDMSDSKTLGMTFRYFLEIHPYTQAFFDLYDALRTYLDVNFRYVVFPTEKMPGLLDDLFPLDFSNKSLMKMHQLGEEDALHYITEYHNNPTNQHLIDELKDFYTFKPKVLRKTAETSSE